MAHRLPNLPYGYRDLEPHIDKRTMVVHHDMHHQAYVDNLNKALEGYPDLQSKTTVELLRDLDSVPEEIRTAVRNNGGGHANHSMFWPSMGFRGGGGPDGKLLDGIVRSFGSYTDFKDQFSQAAVTLFSNGWTWLCVDGEGGFVIVTTQNQDNPISQDLIPILGLDVWEHAYYLKYENRRAEYVAAWWNVVNWSSVGGYLATVGMRQSADQVSDWAKSTWSQLEEGWSKLTNPKDS
jgi:Fe-Mn family superoxide dismutase